MQLPHIVSKGAQYIFLDFANKIEGEWKKTINHLMSCTIKHV